MEEPVGPDEPVGMGRLALAGPILLGLALRALLAGFTNTPSVDGAAFLLPLARDLLAGDLLDWRWGTFPPLYPAAVAAVRPILGDLVLAGQVVSVAAGTLVIPPGALIARRLLGADAARRAAWLLAVLPLACHYSARPQTEALYACLFTWAVYGLLRLVEERGAGRAALVGTLAGLATATRPEGAALLVAGGVVILIPPGRLEVRRAGKVLAALILPFLCLQVPVLALTHHVTGRWTLSSKAGYIFHRNLQEDPDAYYFRLTPDRDQLLFETYIRQPEGSDPFDPYPREPGRILRTYASSLGRMAVNFPRAYDPPLLLLALLGLFLRPRPRWTRPGKVVVALLAAYLLLLPIFSAERRFWVALLPMVIPLSVRGVGGIPVRWRRVVLVSTLLLLLPHAGSPARDQGFRWQDSPERRLATLLPEGARVLSEDGRVAVSAEVDHIFLPVAPAGDVLHFARRKGADFLAVDPKRLEVRRPGLLEGLQPLLRKVGEERGRGRRIVLFEIGDRR